VDAAALGAACEALVRDLDPLEVSMSASWDSENNMLTVDAESNDPQVDPLAVYFEFPFYAPIPEGTYVFTMRNRGRVVTLRSSLERIPDSGGVTESEWQDFAGQLDYPHRRPARGNAGARIPALLGLRIARGKKSFVCWNLTTQADGSLKLDIDVTQ
jgi:hypothetical protein